MGNIIEAEGLTRVFGTRPAVRGLDLEVATGEIFGLLGPNGAGKSTTIRMLTTLLPPSSGRAFVGGFDICREAAQVRRLIGYVSQEKGVRYLLTGRESVEIESALYHVPSGLRKRRVDDMLSLMGLMPHAERFVAEYSGGMQKRLDLACGLLHLPDVLFLDEPTLGLDVQSRHRIWEHVAELRDQGVTVLMATNYLDEADRLCDRIAIIDDGQIVVTGTPADLKRAIKTDVIEVSSGQPGKLQAAITGQSWAHCVVPVGTSGLRIQVRDAARALPEVISTSVQHGVSLDRVTYSQPTLDDVFLMHTGRGLRESGERPETDRCEPRISAVAHRADRAAIGGFPAWRREVASLLRRWNLQLRRERLNLFFTLVQPAIWLVFFGTAMGRAVDPHILGTTSYVGFMLPGVVAFTLVGSGISGAIPLLWDKETGYLSRLLSMPIARSSLLVSRLVFQVMLGMAQTLMILVVALVMGINVETQAPGVLVVLCVAGLLAIALTALFMALAFASPGHNTFFAISGFIALPLVFASNAFVPLHAMPTWMAMIARFNPLTYAIESIRILVISGWRTGLAGSLGVLVLFAGTSLLLGIYQFRVQADGIRR